jgi:hypothetical protein
MQTRWTLALLVTLAACGGPLKYNVASSARAPGADAKVVADVKKDQNQTQLEINAKHLPPPDRVTQGATTYLVWERKDSAAAWQRLGALKYDGGDRDATWQGSVPETSFDLVITAEHDAVSVSPSGDTIFTQRVN